MRRGLLAALLVLAGCHGKAAAPDAGSAPKPVGPHPLFFADANAALNPFPDDRLVEGGALHARSRFWEDYLPQSALSKTLTGFEEGNEPSFETVSGHGNSGPTLVRFSEAIDPTSLDGHVFFVQQEAGSPVWEVAAPPKVTYTELAGDKDFLSARPDLPLAGGRRAALVLTRGIKTRSGTLLDPAPDFTANQPADIGWMATKLGVTPDDVLLSVELDVQDASADLLRLAAWAGQDAGVPHAIHLADGGNDPNSPLGVWSGDAVGTWAPYLQNADAKRTSDGGFSDVGALVMGTFQSHDLRELVHDPSTGVVTSSAFKPAWLQDPDASPTVDLRFILVLPKQRQANGRYRVVIGAHGLGGRNTFDVSARSGGPDVTSFCGGLAELFAANGLGCIGIDAVDHGSRTPGGDADLVSFFNVSDLRSTRDNFRQTDFDLLQLSRLVGQLDIDGDGVPDLDPDDVGFFGNSLGGIMGSVFMATDTRVKYGVLNVPTGGLSMMFDAPNIHGLLGFLISVRTGVDSTKQPDFDQSLKLIEAEGQLVIEPADPFNYAYLLPHKRVLAQEAVGDQTLPNANTDELFAAAHLPEVTASSGDDGGLSGFERFDPKLYGITDPGFNPHGTFYAVPQMREQAVDFLVSRGTRLTYEHP